MHTSTSSPHYGSCHREYPSGCSFKPNRAPTLRINLALFSFQPEEFDQSEESDIAKHVVKHIFDKFARFLGTPLSKCRSVYMLCNIFVTFCQK